MAGSHSDHAKVFSEPVEAERLTRRPHSDFHFGANRHPLHEWTEDVRQEGVEFVSAVEPDLFTQQTRGDAYPDGAQFQRSPRS